jgi:hypothetical protein
MALSYWWRGPGRGVWYDPTALRQRRCPLSVTREWRDIDPQWRRLWAGIALLVLTAIGLLAVIYFSLQVESGVRAYVGGESLYSKGQKDAVYHLIRYAATRDELEYDAYLAAIAVPQGDEIARL